MVIGDSNKAYYVRDLFPFDGEGLWVDRWMAPDL